MRLCSVPRSRADVARGRWRLQLVLVGLMLLALACTWADDGPKEPAESESSIAASDQTETEEPPSLGAVTERLTAAEADAAPLLPSALPAVVRPVPQRSVALLEDPPGRAVLAATALDSGFSAESFADHTNYFYGSDGVWRRLNMAELGIRPDDWDGPDGSGSGALSPDGHYWAFDTRTRVGVMDLTSGALSLHGMPGFEQPVVTSWTHNGLLLVRVAGRLRHPGYVMDPVTGRASILPPVLAENIAPVPGGNWAAFPAGRHDAERVATYDSDGTELDSVQLPFASGDILTGHFADSQVAFFRARYLQGDIDAMFIVADRVSLAPQAAIQVLATESDVGGIGWADGHSFVFLHDNAIFAWQPTTGSVRAVTRMRGEVIVDIAIERVGLTDG